MNRQYKNQNKRGIEWADYTWNPVAGCQHGCRWKMPDGTIAICYAEAVAERIATSAYSEGFSHHYWRPEVLEAPLKVRKSAKIFLDSMSDLMGHWVSEEEILKVLEVCRQASQHQFQLLTKNAPRLLQFDFPDNVWVGVSAPPTYMMGKQLSYEQQKRMVDRQVEVLHQVKAKIRWMSIEPLSFDIAPLLENSPLEWAVIGAATNGAKTYQPKPEWVQNVLKVLDEQGTKVFFKGNLEWSYRLEDFPAVTQTAGAAVLI